MYGSSMIDLSSPAIHKLDLLFENYEYDLYENDRLLEDVHFMI